MSTYALSSAPSLYPDLTISVIDPKKPGNRLYEVDGQIFLQQKTLAEVLGEKFLAPVVDYVSGAFTRLKTVAGGMYQAAMWIDSYFQFPVAGASSVPRQKPEDPISQAMFKEEKDEKKVALRGYDRPRLEWVEGDDVAEPAKLGKKLQARSEAERPRKGPKVSVESKPGVWEELETTTVSSAKGRRMQLMRDADGIGGEFRVNTMGYSIGPDVTAFSDGGFVVVWQSVGQLENWNVYLQRYDKDGNKLGTESLVNMHLYGMSQWGPSISTLSNGRFVVSWSGRDSSQSGIRLQVYGGSGNKIGSEVQVNTYVQSYQATPSTAALADGEFVVTWESDGQDGSGYGVYLQRYDAEGIKMGGESQVNTYTLSNQQYPVIMALPDSGFVVAWQSADQDGSESGIYLQRYDRTGNKLGPESQVNTYRQGSQSTPSIIALPDGGFVVVWNSYGQDGSGYGVYLQRYDASGNKIGSESQVNTYIQGAQWFSDITALPDGGFVIVWTSEGQDGSGYGIYLQRYDGFGNKLGSEFQVNTYTQDDQGGSNMPDGISITTLSNSGFVVVWVSKGQNGDSDIYGKRFDSNGTVLTFPIGNSTQPPISKSDKLSSVQILIYVAIGVGGLCGLSVLGAICSCISDNNRSRTPVQHGRISTPVPPARTYSTATSNYHPQIFTTPKTSAVRKASIECVAIHSVPESVTKEEKSETPSYDGDEKGNYTIGRRYGGGYAATELRGLHQLKNSKKHGISLELMTSYTFELRLYNNGSMVDSHTHTDLRDSSYPFDSIAADIERLPSGNFEASKSYYYSKVSSLKSDDASASAYFKSEREEARREIEREQQIQRESQLLRDQESARALINRRREELARVLDERGGDRNDPHTSAWYAQRALDQAEKEYRNISIY
ncbi:MAG: hypothetical protein Q8929_00200 [Bacillota bacterium]|nr:hypothetical protein [Bacillota bacterium]